jgi:hypothetical protein
MILGVVILEGNCFRYFLAEKCYDSLPFCSLSTFISNYLKDPKLFQGHSSRQLHSAMSTGLCCDTVHYTSSSISAHYDYEFRFKS